MARSVRLLVLGSALFLLCRFSAAAAPPQSKAAQKTSQEKVEAILDEAVLDLWHQADEHWHQGEYNHIINICRVVAASRPNMMDAYANAGWLLWSMNRDEEAVAFYEQGLKANQDSYGMYDELGFYFFHRKKDYPRAIGYYERAVTFKDVQPFTLHMLANAYERTHQFAKAEKVWARAAAIPHDISTASAKARLARVRKLLKQG